MITQELLERRFNYDPKTGKLSRKYRELSDCPTLASQTNWNNRISEPIGGLNTKGYLCTTINTKVYRVHRLIWLLVIGSWPEYAIDHINGIRNDNRWCNLRDTSDNNKNKTIQSRNTSGTIGIIEYGNTCRVHIGVNKQSKYLGSYKTLEEATIVRKAAEVKYGYHPNHGKSIKLNDATVLETNRKKTSTNESGSIHLTEGV